MLDWAHVGVNITVRGNGGPECAAYLSMVRRLLESVFVMVLTAPLINWGFRNLSPIPSVKNEEEPLGKRVLLVLMTIIFGIEIGFKFSSKTVIFLLNPCHVTTALQIYLLAAPPGKNVGAVFRFHLNCMNGAVLALGFPELDALNLPFETWIYWIQHTMMLIIPIYLLLLGGVFQVEDLTDMSWAAVSYGILLVYHFVLLQALAVPAQVNLNHMLCPAVKDPFYGQHYRMYAIVHQAFLCPFLSKSVPAIVRQLATKQHLS